MRFHIEADGAVQYQSRQDFSIAQKLSAAKSVFFFEAGDAACAPRWNFELERFDI